VDALRRLVSSFEDALQAQRTCCYVLQHFRMYLALWPLIV